MDEVKSVEACCEVDHSQHQDFVEQTDRWDKLGITLSGLCAIHCLLTPIFALAVPALGSAFEQPWVHVTMAFFILPIGVFAFYSGYVHHKKMFLVALGITGLMLVSFGLFTHDLITIAGSACLIFAHILNRRACHCETH